MTFRFNMLLEEAGIDPAQVRLLRHQAPLPGGRTLVDLWHADRAAFEEYQSYQKTSQRVSFARPYWAAFVGRWEGRTMFVGLYVIGDAENASEEVTLATGEVLPAGEADRYDAALSELLRPYAGRLYIEWGGASSGKRAWNQRAEVQNKVVTELHLDGAEKPFPGFMDLAVPLSALADAPPGWIRRLAETRGIYLMTCPRDGSLYVGSATAQGGFWARWADYRANGHGGNVALMNRDRSDFTVSVLQVAGSGDTEADIFDMEATWKRKLMTRELGLNRN